MTKIRIPTCGTCGSEKIVDVNKDDLLEKIQRVKSEEAALVKLLDKVIPGEAPDSYRKTQLGRLIKKARDSLIECEALLEKLD